MTSYIQRLYNGYILRQQSHINTALATVLLIPSALTTFFTDTDVSVATLFWLASFDLTVRFTAG